MVSGPLKGLKVVEMAAIGPVPFVGMLLSDLGCDVIRVDRPSGPRINPLAGSPLELDARGRRSIALNLKEPGDIETCLALIAKADILIEGFRPGVMERLGLGPDVALERNARLIYGRMTGWGQDGPYASMAGHDLNYIAITGCAFSIGKKERPLPALNFVGDYAGALILVAGLLAALNHVHTTGEGQVVDTAMCDAASYLATSFHAMQQAGLWSERREANELDGGAPYYAAYECADGNWISIGSMEPQFYAVLLERLELPAGLAATQRDQSTWPDLAELFSRKFAERTRQEWCSVFEGSDACFAPVLKLSEAAEHIHNQARDSFVTVNGVVQPAPVPRFSKTPGQVQGGPPQVAEHNAAILADWGVC